jgi:hypothetical protein
MSLKPRRRLPLLLLLLLQKNVAIRHCDCSDNRLEQHLTEVLRQLREAFANASYSNRTVCCCLPLLLLLLLQRMLQSGVPSGVATDWSST